MYNHVEVSGHNLENFSLGFFKPYGRGEWLSIKFSSFLLYTNCKRLREFEEIRIPNKAVEVTVNNKEENS
jgi:hypothetical protein